MSSENVKAERDEMITFSFLDQVDGFIELTMDAPQKYSNKGWMIIPHKEPFRVRSSLYMGYILNIVGIQLFASGIRA